MTTKISTNIEDYSHNDLLEILGLNELSTKQQIEDNANTMIARKTSEGKTDIVKFLHDAKEYLLNDQEQLSEDESIVLTSNEQETISNNNKDTKREEFETYLRNVMEKQETQVIHFNTRFRRNYYGTCSTNFTIDLPEAQKKVTSMRLSSIELPLTHYTVSPRLGNNTMLIIGEHEYTEEEEAILFDSDFHPNDRVAWLVTLRDGDYDSTWSSDAQIERTENIVNEAIHHAIPGKVSFQGRFEKMKDSEIGTEYTLVVDGISNIIYRIDRTSKKGVFANHAIDISATTIETSNTNKISTLRFNVDNDGNIDTSTNIQFKLGWTLGFRVAEYLLGYIPLESEDMLTTISPVSAVSEGTPFVSGGYAFLSINDYQNNARPSYLVAHANSMKSDNILTHVKLSTGLTYSRDESFEHNASNRSREYYGPVDISRLTIQLQDEFGRIVDLNNMDWSFTLAFEKNFN